MVSATSTSPADNTLSGQPRSGRFWRDLAQVYFNHRHFDEAVSFYRKAVDGAADDEEKARFLHDLAQSLRQSKTEAEALAVLDRSDQLTQDPIQKVRNQHLAGQIYEDLGRFVEARNAYTYVYRNADKDYERQQAQRRLTELMVRSEDMDSELARLKKGVADVPDDLVQVRVLGDLYRRLNKPLEALPLFEKLAVAAPRDRELLQIIADLYRATGDHRRAIESYETLAEAYPQEKSYCLERIAFVYAGWGKKDKAAEYAELILQDQPTNLGAHIRAAQRFLDIGEKKRAEEVYVRAIALAGSPREREDLRFQLAQLHLQDGRHADAIRMYDEIIKSTQDERKKRRAESLKASAVAAQQGKKPEIGNTGGTREETVKEEADGSDEDGQGR